MNLRRLNIVLHRDIGYFFSGLIIIYCISGLALNHVDDWNPDFVIHRSTIHIPRQYAKADITQERIAEFNSMVGEKDYKIFDFPTPEHVKIYYDNATLHINIVNKVGIYEKVERLPFIYESNVIHRNSLKGWKWASDVFAVMLIFISITGWFMLKGKSGIIGRGKWFIAAGMVPPIVAIILFEVLQK